MRAFVLVAALSVVSSPSVLAQTAPPAQQPAAQTVPAAALPDARAILDRHIELIGGRAAFLAHTSSRVAGTFSVPKQGMSGTFEAFGAKPNKLALAITMPGIGTIVDGTDGTYAWNVSPMMGPILASGKELEQKKFDADFYAELHDPARYESIKTVEKTTFAGKPAYKISLVRKGGGEDFEFYDVASGLKLGAIMVRETPLGPMTVTETRGDYKKFGDLLQPGSITQALMGTEQVLTIDTVEYDKVDPKVFEMPAQIKALIK